RALLCDSAGPRRRLAGRGPLRQLLQAAAGAGVSGFPHRRPGRPRTQRARAADPPGLPEAAPAAEGFLGYAPLGSVRAATARERSVYRSPSVAARTDSMGQGRHASSAFFAGVRVSWLSI